MLCLSKDDISQLVVFEDIIAVIKQAMEVYHKKQFMQPDRITINVSEAETYLYMPCFTGAVKGTKVLTLSQENYKYNLPMLQGVMLLNDPKTGQILCMLDGASVTGFRTGAVGATGIKYTSKESDKNLGIIGAGAQAFYQALYAASVRKLENIYVFDALADKCRDFAKTIQERLPQINVRPAASAEELVKNSEIIVTVTPSTTPVFPDSAELMEGKHFVGIGSYKPIMNEYPKSIYQLLDKIYIDVDFALEESGDLIIPCEKGWFKKENIQTLYPAIQDKSIDPGKTTFFKSVGMALFDILVANNIYQKALVHKMGQTIKL